MKYRGILGFVLCVCGLAYLRSEQPKIWNEGLAALKVPEEGGSSSSSAPMVSAPPPAAASPANATADAATAPAPTQPQGPEYVSPNSTNWINPDHVRQVEQPGLTSASPTSPIYPKSYVPPAPLPAKPNWTWTVDGKVYENVVVTEAEADRVHISYDGGVGTINMVNLPPDLQKLLNYDPDLAGQAATQRSQQQAQIDAQENQKLAALAQAPAAQEAHPSDAGPATSPPHSEGNPNQAQIDALQRQIASLQTEAQSLDAAEVSSFNSASNIYYNQAGQVEHRHSLGHSQQADADRAQIQDLQVQLASLQGH